MYYSIFQRSGDLKDFFQKAPITSIIIVLNTIMYIYTIVYSGFHFISFSPTVLAEVGGIYQDSVLNNGEWWRLLTGAFLHGGLLHFILNSIIGLFMLSYGLERLIGSLKFSFIYFGSLILSGLLVVYTSTPYQVTIGASGAIFGVLASLFFITIYRKDKITQRDAQTVRTLAGVNIAFTFFSMISGGNISVSGHVGGFVAGFLLSYLVIRRNIFKVLH